jgi:hypothetical protein
MTINRDSSDRGVRGVWSLVEEETCHQFTEKLAGRARHASFVEGAMIVVEFDQNMCRLQTGATNPVYLCLHPSRSPLSIHTGQVSRQVTWVCDWFEQPPPSTHRCAR